MAGVNASQRSNGVSKTRMLLRAMGGRCPLCSVRWAWFTSWFRRQETCRRCSFRWRRGDDGFETGSMIINFIVTGGLMGVVLIVTAFTTYPNLPEVPLLIALCGIALIVPFVSFPFTNFVWSAVELCIHPLEGEERELLAEYRSHRVDPPSRSS